MFKARHLVVAAIVCASLFAMTAPAHAAVGTGTVTVSAATLDTITISIADGSADFGTNLDPTGTDSNSSDAVFDVNAAGGSYYVWKTGGVGITVSSTKPWSSTVSALESTGTASQKILTGALLWKESAPSSYSSCSSATAFSTVPSAWHGTALAPISSGVTTYTTYYCFRDDFTDVAGTFNSTVTYTATQSLV